jgi:hypothetical protein
VIIRAILKECGSKTGNQEITILTIWRIQTLLTVENINWIVWSTLCHCRIKQYIVDHIVYTLYAAASMTYPVFPASYSVLSKLRTSIHASICLFVYLYNDHEGSQY